MYKIIGADQKQYGPVTGDQIRQWITDGRVNGQTQAQAAGTEEWKPLATYPEFADIFGAPATPPASVGQATIQTSGDREAALQAVKGPAIALLVVAIIDLVVGFYSIASLAFFPPDLEKYSQYPQFNEPQVQRLLHVFYGPIGMANSAFEMLISLLILIGALRMRALRTYPLVLTASVLAVIPCITPCCGIITIPFGIWALVVLNKPGIKSQFT